ncbi:MAG: FtsL-like putative cell division protein [Bacteroidales bacterium]|jgi:membrane protein insertase Oxa1/YidC/SpoIIIJ|nr:FtsL-like putative cell division protein [Bacteroidales bacterium]MDD3724727.1 FtsL-like putative cell division protein [Bacteroidales bacterium]MDD4544351.1 FtsL-like putative cell division protein [Bacteroidales bacterium]MDY0053266.1 FtsL-like putative cell division protein [Bacteroidales bacterium]
MKEVNSIIGGGFLVKGSFLSWMPAIIFSVLLIVLYISNRYYLETTLKEMDNLEIEINALQKKYSDQKGEYQKATQMLELEKRLEPIGVKVAKERIKQTILY